MCVDVCIFVCTCMYVHEHIYMYITYIKDCSKMTSLWYNMTSCLLFICKDAVISTPHSQRVRFSIFMKVVIDGVTHPYSSYWEVQLIHSTLLR